MSKSHRGAGLKEKTNRGRGTCPVCKRTRIKTIYTHEHNGLKIDICKICRASISNGKYLDILNEMAPPKKEEAAAPEKKETAAAPEKAEKAAPAEKTETAEKTTEEKTEKPAETES